MSNPPKNVHIFQIYYDEATKASLDPGFLPLDNSDNPRPDWREYWPIRNFLLKTDLEEQRFYGFFSPKFRDKTSLEAQHCYTFIAKNSKDTDVFLFSPSIFADQMAFYQNVFLQNIRQDPKNSAHIVNALKVLDPRVDIHQLVNHSGNTVFSNYFVARPRFWRVWLEKCELIFKEAEENISEVGKGLNSVTSYPSPAQVKVFIIERIAPLILASDPSWKVKIRKPPSFNNSDSMICASLEELDLMDALKIAFTASLNPAFFNLFRRMQYDLLTNHQKRRGLISKKGAAYKNQTSGVHVFIISWPGHHENAMAIARQLIAHSSLVSVVYSDLDPNFNFVPEANVEFIKRPNTLYFGDKFKACLDHCKANHILLIHADCEYKDWVSLLKGYEHTITHYPDMAVWCPEIDETPWTQAKTGIGSIDGTPLEVLAMFDAIVFGLNTDIIERMRRVNYEENIYGWGIDWMIAAHVRTLNHLIIMDKSFRVHHKGGANYDMHEARLQMQTFLNQLTKQERLNFLILEGFTRKN